jgi:hypothetical protein
MTQTPDSDYLQKVIAAQARIINYQRDQLDDCADELAWFTNSNLPIAARFAGYAVQKFIEQRKPGEDGRYKAYLPAMGDAAGVSDSTISRGVKILASATDALDKETLDEWDENGNKHSTLYIQPLDLFRRPQEVKPTKEIKKHGGDHRIVYCDGCGSENIVETKKWVCADCGQVHKTFKQRLVNTPLQDATAPESSEETPGDPDPLLLAILPVNTRVSDCTVLPPAWLRSKKIWCPRRGKVPYQTHGRIPQKAKTDDPATWSTYDQALAIVEQSQREGWKEPFDGIGFMCDGSFVGIDLDHCRNKETGEIAAWALDIVARFPGACIYITPSGEGLRIVIGGKKPGPRCKKDGIEIYEEKRFFTWTPEQLADTSPEIVDGQAELNALYKEVFPEPVTPVASCNGSPVTLPCSYSDEKILETARNARNGPKFTKLWNGDASDYRKKNGSPDYSSADLALCEMLSYYGGGRDVFTIDRLFQQSHLFRKERWFAPARAGETYGQGTIKRAIAMAMSERMSA